METYNKAPLTYAQQGAVLQSRGLEWEKLNNSGSKLVEFDQFSNQVQEEARLNELIRQNLARLEVSQ